MCGRRAFRIAYRWTCEWSSTKRANRCSKEHPSYALFTRGLEHALKAAEAAVTGRARAAGVAMIYPDGRPTGFAFRIGKLNRLKILSRADVETWTQIRELRNFTAHPEQPFLVTPAVAISVFGTIADSIEQLFS